MKNKIGIPKSCYQKIKKLIDDDLKRSNCNFTAELIEKHSFWEVEELLSIGHYKISKDYPRDYYSGHY